MNAYFMGSIVSLAAGSTLGVVVFFVGLAALGEDIFAGVAFFLAAYWLNSLTVVISDHLEEMSYLTADMV
jgi:hypothetical protein